jgi:hypothetical protein
MQYKISRYFISLLIFLIPTISVAQHRSYSSREEAARRQSVSTKKEKEQKPRIMAPLFNGLYLGADIYGIGSSIVGSDFLSSEIQAGVNLKNRYMPTVEIGYGKTDTWNENGIHYKTNAPYARVGFDYNMRWKKVDYEDWLFVGLRYGYSSFKYDVESASIIDPVYGGMVGNPTMDDTVWKGSVPFHKTGMKGSMSWYELVFGIRSKIYKNFMMGLSLRFRYKMSATMDQSAHPWYVPGYGKYDSKSTGLTYSLIYKFSLGAKKPTVITPIDQSDNKPKVKFARKQQKTTTPFNNK